MKRRTFLEQSAGLLFLFSVVPACSGDDSDSDSKDPEDSGPKDSGDPEETGETGETGDTGQQSNGASGVSDSHGHLLSIPGADLDSPADKTYSATGGGHAHSVPLTAAQLTTLAGGTAVTTSTNDTHPHTWTITPL